MEEGCFDGTTQDVLTEQHTSHCNNLLNTAVTVGTIQSLAITGASLNSDMRGSTHFFSTPVNYEDTRPLACLTAKALRK